MLSLLLLTGTAFPCAALLTNDEGAIASSDAQEVVLQATETGSRTHYRVSYQGDADSFGWLIVVPGFVGEGDVIESEASLFDNLREQTQPRKFSYDIGDGGDEGESSSAGCGCGDLNARAGSNYEFDAADTAGGAVAVTAEGFAGPYSYQVLDATDADGLAGWLEDEGVSLGDTVTTLDEYIAEGGYSFVAVSLTPDENQTPDEGRTLPPLAIDSDSSTLQFPARMSLTGMAEELRTTVWVVGETTARITEGWTSTDVFELSASDGDAEGAYDAALRAAAVAEPAGYLASFSGEYNGFWVTRFDALAPREVHTADPVFDFLDEAYSWRLDIEVPANEDDDTALSALWLFAPLLGLGWVRRRHQA